MGDRGPGVWSMVIEESGQSYWMVNSGQYGGEEPGQWSME